MSERERERVVCWLVSVDLGGQEIKSLDLSHLWVFVWVFLWPDHHREKHAGTPKELVNPLHKKAAPWCPVLNHALCIKCKPWGLVLKNITKLAGGLLL